MATDPDRQSDGDPERSQRRALSRIRGAIHAALQLAWALAVSIPMIWTAMRLVDRPSPGAAWGIVEITAVWALVAGLAWALRVAALTSCGPWGTRTRRRVRDTGRSREAATR